MKKKDKPIEATEYNGFKVGSYYYVVTPKSIFSRALRGIAELKSITKFSFCDCVIMKFKCGKSLYEYVDMPGFSKKAYHGPIEVVGEAPKTKSTKAQLSKGLC